MVNPKRSGRRRRSFGSWPKRRKRRAKRSCSLGRCVIPPEFSRSPEAVWSTAWTVNLPALISPRESFPTSLSISIPASMVAEATAAGAEPFASCFAPTFNSPCFTTAVVAPRAAPFTPPPADGARLRICRQITWECLIRIPRSVIYDIHRFLLGEGFRFNILKPKSVRRISMRISVIRTFQRTGFCTTGKQFLHSFQLILRNNLLPAAVEHIRLIIRRLLRRPPVLETRFRDLIAILQHSQIRSALAPPTAPRSGHPDLVDHCLRHPLERFACDEAQPHTPPVVVYCWRGRPWLERQGKNPVLSTDPLVSESELRKVKVDYTR